MSVAEDINEAFDVEDVEDENLDSENADQESEEQEEVAEHQEAPKTGADKMFIDKETWVKQGRDPELWISKETFKERSERINLQARLNRQEKEFNKRLEGVNQFNENLHRFNKLQIDQLRAQLDAKRDDAIELADVKEVKRIDKELRDIDAMEDAIKPEQPAAANVAPEIAEWNAENDWLTLDNPNQAAIQQEYLRHINEGKTIATALRKVDLFILKNNLKPNAIQQTNTTAQQRQPRSLVDNPKGGAVVKSQSNLSWESLSRDEKEIYDALYADAGVSKKEYLQSVADSKKGL